jgi:hypothetical protein
VAEELTSFKRLSCLASCCLCGLFRSPPSRAISFYLSLQRRSPGQLSYTYRSIAMQAHDSASDTDSSEGGVGGAGQPPANNVAAIHALNEMRAAALRGIDEAGFSCVASFSPSFARLLTVRLKRISSEIMLCRRHWVFHGCVSTHWFHASCAFLILKMFFFLF